MSYLDPHPLKCLALWKALQDAGRDLPALWPCVAAAAAADGDVRDVYQAALLALQVQRRGIRHLHAHFANVATSVARLAAKMCGISYSFTAHAKDIFHDEVDRSLLRTYLNEASHVIAISDYNRDHLAALCPEGAERIHRIYNGLELNRYPFSDLSGRSEQIIAVGRLVEKKGFGTLIEACRLLRDDGLAIPCRIIGVGPLQETLQQQISALGLADQIRLEGARTHGGIIEAVSGASIFAAPCVTGSDGNRDGLPTVLLEAMALGTPCISTDVTGIPELLRHQQSGLCVGQHDAAALAQAIRRLQQEPVLAAQLASRARALVEAQFDSAGTSAQIAALHRRCCVSEAGAGDGSAGG